MKCLQGALSRTLLRLKLWHPQRTHVNLFFFAALRQSPVNDVIANLKYWPSTGRFPDQSGTNAMYGMSGAQVHRKKQLFFSSLAHLIPEQFRRIRPTIRDSGPTPYPPRGFIESG